MIINSIPAPELTNPEISQEDLNYYLEGLKQLESLSPDFIVMVCNTIHIFYKYLQSNINIPIINLRYEVRKKLKDKKYFILATPQTIKKLYNFNNIIKPTKEEILFLSQCVNNFNKGFNKENQKRKIEELCRKYINLGAQGVLLGCTEFAVMLKNCNFPALNTIDILVDSAINKFQTFKNKN